MSLKEKLAVCIAFLVLVFAKPLLAGFDAWGLDGKLSWDVFGYYLYLPATFIYHDPLLTDMSWFHQLFEFYQPSPHAYQIRPIEGGTHMIHYSMGMAVLMLPFYFLGHLWAIISGMPADGLSAPYQIAIGLGSYFYLFIGLIFTFKILRQFFSFNFSLLGIFLLILATNFTQIGSNTLISPHVYGFFLYSLILWNTIRYYQTQKTKFALWGVFFFGLAILLRPTAFLLLVLILFWNVGSWADIKSRLKYWRTRWKILVWAFLIVFTVGLPQMIYWYAHTGSPIFYSYTGDGFDFLTPYIPEVLWSYRKGWWLYTPLMVLSLAGMWPLWTSNRKLALPLLIFWVVNLYVLSSWNAWWYGGSFGHRAFVDAYGIFLIPILAFIKWMFDSRGFPRVATTIFLLAATVLNLFQSWQMNHWILHQEQMNKRYYWAVFGKTSVTPQERKLLGIKRGPNTQFDNREEYRLVLDTLVSATFEMGSENIFSDEKFKKRVLTLSEEEHIWVVATANIRVSDTLEKSRVYLTIKTTHGSENIKWRAEHPLVDGEKLYPGKSYKILHEYFTPLLKSKRDKLVVQLEKHAPVAMTVDSMRVQIFEPVY